MPDLCEIKSEDENGGWCCCGADESIGQGKWDLMRYYKQLRKRKSRRKRKKKCPIKLAPLQNWDCYLYLRRRLCRKIARRTGKKPDQILLNSSGVTEKAMLQRLFELAERTSSERQWQQERLYQFTTKCDLHVSLPDKELLKDQFSIYGLPGRSKEECQISHHLPKWFHSKLIQKRLQKYKYDIFDLLDWFPDLECLQVVGTRVPIYVPILCGECNCLASDTSSDDDDDLTNETDEEALLDVQKLGSLGSKVSPTTITANDATNVVTVANDNESKNEEEALLNIQKLGSPKDSPTVTTNNDVTVNSEGTGNNQERTTGGYNQVSESMIHLWVRDVYEQWGVRVNIAAAGSYLNNGVVLRSPKTSLKESLRVLNRRKSK